MTAHQPPTQQAVLIQKQLSHSKLTSITGKCFSTTLNCIRTHQAVTDHQRRVHVHVREGGCDWSVRLRPAASAVFLEHVITLKLNEYITPQAAPGTHPDSSVSIMLQETGRLILVSWRRTICIERGATTRALQLPPLPLMEASSGGGFERPGITKRAETPSP